MRKIDYQIMADIIRAGIASCEAQQAKDNRPEFYFGGACAFKVLARSFANRASVNSEEFLRACGISE